MLKKRYPALPAPKLAVACAAVKRVHAQKEYSPHNYEVCFMREGYDGLYMFPGGRVASEQDPGQATVKYLQRQTGLHGNQSFPLHVHGKPSDGPHVVTLFYVTPVGLEGEPIGFPSMETKFHNLAYVLQNEEGSYNMVYGQREMVFVLDQWLRERHAIPFVNMDLLFMARGSEGIGGQLLALIENPVYESKANPPENTLLVSLNNPMFEEADKRSTSTRIP